MYICMQLSKLPLMVVRACKLCFNNNDFVAAHYDFSEAAVILEINSMSVVIKTYTLCFSTHSIITRSACTCSVLIIVFQVGMVHNVTRLAGVFSRKQSVSFAGTCKKIGASGLTC